MTVIFFQRKVLAVYFHFDIYTTSQMTLATKSVWLVKIHLLTTELYIRHVKS